MAKPVYFSPQTTPESNPFSDSGSSPPIALLPYQENRPGSNVWDDGFAQGPTICGPMDVDVEFSLLDPLKLIGINSAFAASAESRTPEELYKTLREAQENSEDAYVLYQIGREGLRPLITGVRNVTLAEIDYANRMKQWVQDPKSQALHGQMMDPDHPQAQLAHRLWPRINGTLQPQSSPDDFFKYMQQQRTLASRMNVAEKGLRIALDGYSIIEGSKSGIWDWPSIMHVSAAGLDVPNAIQSFRAYTYFNRGNNLFDASPVPAGSVNTAGAPDLIHANRLYMQVGVLQLISGGVRVYIEVQKYTNDVQGDESAISLGYAVLDLSDGATSVAYTMQIGSAAQAAAAAGEFEEASRIILGLTKVGDGLRITSGYLSGVTGALTFGLSVYTFCEVALVNPENYDDHTRHRLETKSVFGMFGGAVAMAAARFAFRRAYSYALLTGGFGLVIFAAGFMVDYFVFSDDDPEEEVETKK